MKILSIHSRLFAAAVLTAACVLTTGCAHWNGTGNSRVWIAGGSSTKTWQEPKTADPATINANVSTFQMIFWQPKTPSFESIFGGAGPMKLFWGSGNNVQVMNFTDSGTPEIRTITLAGGSVFGIATDRGGDGDYVYAAKPNDGTIVAIDGQSESVAGTLKLKSGEQVYALAASLGGGFAVTENALITFSFDGASLSELSSVPFPNGGQGYEIATDNEGYVVVTDISNNKVYVFPLGNGGSLGTPLSALVPSANTVAIVQKGSLAYVTSVEGSDNPDTGGPSTVYAVSLSASQSGVSATPAFTAGKCPGPIEVVGTGDYPTQPVAVLVTNTCEHTVTRFDIATQKTTTIDVGGTPAALAAERP